MEAISTTFTDADLQIGSRRRQTLVRNDLGRGCRSGGYVSGHPPRPRSVTQSLLTVYPNRRIDHTGSPVILRPQGRYTCNLRAAGLPPIRPASRVPSGPALVRSLSIALSNSAKAPSIWIIIRPAVVVVSTPSVKTAKSRCFPEPLHNREHVASRVAAPANMRLAAACKLSMGCCSEVRRSLAYCPRASCMSRACFPVAPWGSGKDKGTTVSDGVTGCE